MKILEKHAGGLTNFEVLDFLRSRGAGKDSTRHIASIASSEYKVYDYLVQTPACNQTRDVIHEYLVKCKSYGLSKAEIRNLINIRPTCSAEIYPILEEPDARFSEEKMKELIKITRQVLPSPPTEMETDKGVEMQTDERVEMETNEGVEKDTNEDVEMEKEETPDGQQDDVKT